MRHFILTVTIAAAIAPVQAVQADARCLVGKWQVANETINQNGTTTSVAAAEWSVDGGLVIEILPTAEVRLEYTDYVVKRITSKASFEVLLEVQYSGRADGRLTPYGGGQSLSLKGFSDVSRSARQRIGDGDWIDAGTDDESPPHQDDGFDFVCDDDELTLSRTDEGPFGGDYLGRFVRID